MYNTHRKETKLNRSASTIQEIELYEKLIATHNTFHLKTETNKIETQNHNRYKKIRTVLTADSNVNKPNTKRLKLSSLWLWFLDQYTKPR